MFGSYQGWWTLPGPSTVVHRILRDFRAGRSVVTLEPEWSPDGLSQALMQNVRDEGYLEWLSLVSPAGSGNVLEKIAFSCGETDPLNVPNRVEDLCATDWFQHRIVFVDLAGRQEKTDGIAKWVQFIDEWQVVVSRDIDPFERALFLLRIDAASLASPPKSDAALSVHKIDDYANSMDIQMHVHLKSVGIPENSLRQELATELCVSIAGGDPRLVDHLLGLEVEDLVRPGSYLQEFAADRDWTSVEGEKKVDGLAGAAELWQQGKVSRFNGSNLTHCAWLQVLGHTSDIDKRVWAAQLRVIFPAIEKWRVEFLQRHLHRFPAEKDPLAMEVGPLIAYMMKHSIRPDNSSDWDLLHLIRDVRNQLAHFTPVHPGLLQALLRTSNF